MCGILAYIGHRQGKDVALEGLYRLQYRGYDSAGLAVAGKKGFVRLRAEGNLNNLRAKIDQKDYQGLQAMGHTRWATHGAPVERNAHPHKAGPIYIVHNGVIENAGELKAGLPAELRSQMTSETDTETAAFLLWDFYQKTGSLKTAVFQTMSLLKGEYAVVLMSEEDPKTFWAFKKGPSLLVGFGREEVFIASDVQAVLPYTRKVVFLQDQEAVYIKGAAADKIEFYSMADSVNKTVKDAQGAVEKNSIKAFKKIDKSIEVLSGDEITAGAESSTQQNKKACSFNMLREIQEQPASLDHLLSRHLSKNKKGVELQWEADSEENILGNIIKQRRLCIAACGSSYYAAMYGKYVIEKWARFPVEVDISSEFRYRDPVLAEHKTPILLISQSGETADTLAVLKMAKAKACPVLSLCNVLHSSLNREADFSLQIFAGLEKGVASTKTFTSTLLVLYLLALSLARRGSYLSTEEECKKVQQLLCLPSQMQTVLLQEQAIAQQAKALTAFNSFIYLGRGVLYPLALEGALKMKELSYKPAAAYPSGEMKHGPLALVDDKAVVIGLMPLPEDLLYKKTLTSLREVQSRGAKLILMGDKPLDSSVLSVEHFISLPLCSEELFAVLNAAPLQLLALYMATALGHNVDQPRNLAKSVTVE